jgi:hypothetical protein
LKPEKPSQFSGLVSFFHLIETILAAIYQFHKESEKNTSFQVQEDTMQRYTRLCFIVLVVAVLFTFGCAAKRICTVTIPCTTKLSNYDCFKIYNLNLFEDVVNAECPNDAENIVALKGDITYLKRVTKAARLLAGAYAGRARVDMDIHLVDFQTGDIIGAASVKGTSTGGSAFAGTTEEAFENTAQLIAEFIRNSY